MSARTDGYGARANAGPGGPVAREGTNDRSRRAIDASARRDASADRAGGSSLHPKMQSLRMTGTGSYRIASSSVGVSRRRTRAAASPRRATFSFARMLCT